jgi:hypothetical protein
VSALSWRMGAEICGPVTKDLKMIDYATKMWKEEIDKAKVGAMNEEPGMIDQEDASWISARN